MTKKVLAAITAIILLFALSACEGEGGEIIDIPSYTDDTDKTDESSGQDNPIELGMTVIESIEELGSHYDLSTYEGLSQLVTDYAYRAKLDIEYIRKMDNCESLYAEYYGFQRALLSCSAIHLRRLRKDGRYGMTFTSFHGQNKHTVFCF